jgi:selenocysteine lyase/cysteine desulfurase
MDAFKSFRKHFPALEVHTYLNTAAWGLMHDGLLEWRQEDDLDYLMGGSQMKIPALKILDQTRNRISDCFNCPSARIALIPNFSLGLNLLLEGLSKDKKVLLLEGDYPSVNWPFETRGFQLQHIPVSNVLLQDIREAVSTHQIEVLALSMVQWIGGEMISMEDLSQLKTEFPNLLIIADGTQYLGAFDMDFEKSGIDVLGASGYKWLLGGNGNGFMCFREGIESFFDIPTTGFNSVEADLSRKDAIPFAKKLEPGHLDTHNFGSLYFSLGLLQDLGLSEIDHYNRELSRKIQTELQSLGLWEKGLPAKQHSTIFNIPDINHRYSKLRKNDIVCSRRGDGIRLSFHCYNSENDLDRLLEVLKTT